jgi:DNA processing protein
MTESELLYQLALSKIPRVGSKIAKHLISYCGSAEGVFKSKRGQLKNIPGIGDYLVNAITSFSEFDKAEKELSKAFEAGVDVLYFTHPEYPKRLKHIHDAPMIIYTRGLKKFNEDKVVAIVGTRSATKYGKHYTESLIEQIQGFKPVVVSGLALGIDITAHQAALANGLNTISVMANGIDMIYPAEHRGVARKIEDHGSLVTEYPMGTKPETHYFPMRNRIIAGLSDAVIVIEAAERGGALITAELANAYNREVFALPGDYDRKYSTGCNQLIKHHKANILTSIDDLVYYLNWDQDAPYTPYNDSTPSIPVDDLEPEEKNVVELLQKQLDGIHIDELSWQTHININKIAGILLNLEFKGLVKPLPGKKYQINRKFVRL